MEPKDKYLDVRSAQEYSCGHIPDAIHIPLDELDTEIEHKLPDRDTSIMVYCRSGIKSCRAAEILQAHGYTNITDFGSIQNWHGRVEHIGSFMSG